MLNKDEMENIEKIKKILNFTTEGTSLKINNEVSKLLLKYINNLEQTNKILDTECNRLEQKESILDKVTEFIKDDVTTEDIKFEGSKTVDFIYKNLINITKEKIAECINSYKDEIEDIIEGEKK